MLRGVVVRLRTPRPVLLVEGRAIYRERFPLNAREKTPDSRAPAATILVVEDDRAVRLLFTKVLQSAGYHVVACENGSAGLEWARKHLDSLDAIVTDARMPAMGGQRLIARVRSLNPNVPAIVVSGNVIEGTPDAMTVFLCKPVTPGALTRELRRLLCDRM
ncbi:MAG TPA: response regulator [Acidobacteriaceae bacterium]|nr:response regulator [Acidobacteriaceae bacterium]